MPHHLHIQSLNILIAVTLATKNLNIPKYYACQAFFDELITNGYELLFFFKGEVRGQRMDTATSCR